MQPSPDGYPAKRNRVGVSKSGRLWAPIVIAIVGVCWMSFGERVPVSPYQDIEVEVTGSDFMFQFRYPGEDRTLFNGDDRYGTGTLFVPADANVHLRLSSLDYIYTLEIPARGVYEMAAPDLVFDAILQACSPRTEDLLGSQMCGYDHPGLIGKVIVQTTEEFDRTMSLLPQRSLILK